MPAPASIFRNVRQTSAGVIAIFLAAHVLLKVGFFSTLFADGVADPVYRVTRGFVAHATPAGLITLFIAALVIFAAGRLRPRDIGLARTPFLNGAVITIFVWAMAQGLVVILGYVDGGNLYFGSPWLVDTGLFLTGIAQAIGVTALSEEIIFRGFLIPQVYFLLAALGRWHWSKCLAVSIVLTQLYFAASHIPAMLRMNIALTDSLLYLAYVFAVGLLLAGLYLRTGNLYVAIGVHGLLNFSAALFEGTIEASFVVILLSCTLLVVWPYLTRVLEDVFTLDHEIGTWLVSERISRTR